MKRNLFLYVVFYFFLISFCNANEMKSSSKIKVINDWHKRYEFIFEDENGNFLFEKQLKRFYGFYEGYATVVLMNWDSAILDENGNISEKHFELLGQRFSEGKNFAQFLDLTTGVIDTKGNTLFKIYVDTMDGYLAATTFYNGRAVIKNSENFWFMIDEKGNKLKEFHIFHASNFSCGFSRIQFRQEKKRTYNYINSDGDFLSSINFDEARDFENNRAKVQIGNDVFYIDTNGNRI